MSEVLRTIGLQIGYKGQPLFPAIDLSLHEGEQVALIGANGSGKTTLFKTLTGNLKPISGHVELCGKPLENYAPNERAKLFSFDIVAAGRYPHSGLMAKLNDKDYEMILSKLELTGVAHLVDRDFVSLSDGEKQKVMIAKALAQDTPIIYMDEPTAFLDYPTKVELMHLIDRLAKEERKTILYSSHDLELLMKHSKQLWVVAKGKPLMAGSPDALNKIIRDYVGYCE